MYKCLCVSDTFSLQLQSLMQQLMVRDFAIFGQEKAGIEHLISECAPSLSVLKSPVCVCVCVCVCVSDSSLVLDSFEQFCVWQLLCAEGPDCSLVIPAIASLNTEGTG